MKDPGAALTARGVTNLEVSEIDMAQDSRPCKGCGTTIYRTVAVAPIKHYCGPDCRPRCSVENCEKPAASKGWCSAHATRAARHGDPLAPKLRGRNDGPCSIEGCDRPMRKRGWCEAHWARWIRLGDVGTPQIPERLSSRPEPARRPAKNPRGPRMVVDDCIVCQKPNRAGDFRSGRFCSAACSALYSRHKGKVPTNPNCARCGTEIDLLAGKNGRRRKSDVKLCKKCKTMHSRHWLSPGELAKRDGPFCQLCGCDVDLLAMFPDVMRASVDHIVPRAWGGSDEPENLQLAHLHCNHVKSDRHDGRSWRATA